ncbi:alpha/beta fold hydrolase [Sediminibacillus halophilus]|uniref:Pimeloyl-ACP methyl ester carboxylesterase n=1 Tax=Sediminibacillus halophilus TaxID=482461 RepID=A0A1G9QQ75_9BACI|nr:alpha/beta hydrolase [Sediminibacillus halophilus]SDM13156.1 Pimeloyl-ACP methyl ester carboxylesterase [Sediminibacillus halophilus]
MEIAKQKKIIRYQNVDIHYRVYHSTGKTDNPCLFLLHGFLSSQFCFRKMIPQLRRHFQIITLDLPPFGKSEKAKAFCYSYQNMADLAMYVLDALNIEKVWIGAHSMGGQVALRCAMHYPERIERLILMAPSCYMKKASRMLNTFSAFPPSPKLLKVALRRAGVDGILKKCMHDEQLITKRMIAVYTKPFLENDIYSCLTKLVRDREGDLPSSSLHTIAQPCLIFWGKQDLILPVSTSYRLLRDLPNAELCTISSVGHFLPEEAPALICDYMLSKVDQG